MTDKPKILDLHTEEWMPKIHAGINDIVQKFKPKVEFRVQEFKDVITPNKLLIHQQSPWIKPDLVKTGLAIRAIIAITAAGICLYGYWHRDDDKKEDGSQDIFPLLGNEEQTPGNKIRNGK